MQKNQAAYSIAVGCFLTLLTTGLIFLVIQDKIAPEIDQALMIIVGMTTVAALTAFQQSIENSASSSVFQISFNEVLVSQSLSEGFPKPDSSVVDKEKVVEPWDLSIESLVSLDKSLALAKLRMDLEGELRRIAYNNRADISLHSTGITRIARELVRREILPTAWLRALEEIIHVCNYAIHGGTDVPDHTAASVVRVGGQLLEQLRSVRNNGGTP